MAYDLDLANRIKSLLVDEGIVERKMFGGVGYLLHGNMVCGVHGENLIARVGPQHNANALKEPGAHPFDMTGRPMTGWVEIDKAAIEEEKSLNKWIQMAVRYCQTLPPK